LIHFSNSYTISKGIGLKKWGSKKETCHRGEGPKKYHVLFQNHVQKSNDDIAGVQLGKDKQAQGTSNLEEIFKITDQLNLKHIK
jgi:hypothetical protein